MEFRNFRRMAMENQSEIGRMFARAEAAFSGGARGEQEDAKDRIFEAARSWPGHAGMFLERIAGLGGKAKRALISDARFWELLGGVRMPKGEASSPPNFGGFEEAAEGWGESGGSHWIGWADRWGRTGSETTAALRGARALGRIREMGDAGLGGAWLRRMIEIGNLEGAKMAEREGVRLSGMSSGQSAQMLLEIARSRSREMAEFWRERGWAPLRKKAEREREREIIAADSLAKRELWDLAIRAGAPEPDFRGVSPSELRRVPEIGGIKALAREIERSGRVGPGSAPLLAFAALASESGMRIYERELELEGPAPLSEGDWIALAGRWGGSEESKARVLEAYAQAGKAIGAGGKGEEEGLVLECLRAGGGERLLGALARLQADFGWKGKDGRSLLMALFDLGGRGDKAARARDLLEAAERAEPGGKAKLLAARDARGAGAAHWAARALCAGSLELLKAEGADPREADRDGKTIARWAASRYGAKAQKAALPAMRWMIAQGVDFGAKDSKGVSALEALARRGPIDAIAEVIRADPSAALSKGGKGKAPIEVCVERGGEAASAAESILIGLKAEGAEGGGRKPRRGI